MLIVFQSPRRWGGVGLAHPAHAEGHGTDDLEIVSIPSEVGRGRAPSSWRITSIPCDSRFVSIPSEVGRGRALHVSAVDDTKVHRSVSFQSPRRWGGVGLIIYGYWFQATLDGFQSPRRWGGVGFCMRTRRRKLRDDHIFRFNPLGGGAGSGSRTRLPRALRFVSIPSEVGRGRALSNRAHRELNLSFNPLGGGAGSGWSIWQALLNAFLLSFNPLGGGAGSG